MKKVSLKVSEEIKYILPETLEKDLQDDERICTTCNGLGIIAVHRPYGIKKDSNPKTKGKMFPYDHQTLTFCPDCFNGVQSLCNYCGKPIEKGYIEKCDCEQYKEIERQNELKKYQDIINKAKEVDEKDIGDTYLYDDKTDKYFESTEDYLDYCESDDVIPSDILWVCSKEEIFLDADWIIENACENLHEDASENCNYSSLQKVLDEWCKQQSGTTSFYPCYQEYVKVIVE